MLGCSKKQPPPGSAPAPDAPSGQIGEQAAPSSHAAGSAEPSAAGNVDPHVRGTTEGEVFSAPIAAVRAHGVDLVAGLVVADAVVRVVAFAGSRTAWTADVLSGVKWAPDAELRAVPAGDGFAILWFGLRDGKPSRTLVQVGPHGEPRGAPAEAGATFCATAEGAAWVGPRASGPTPVRARRWAEPAFRDVLAVPKDRDPTLVCGQHAVVVLGDGSDDLTATWFTPGDAAARPPAVVLRDGEFSDDEREHEAFSVGDDVSLVRIGASGAVAARALTHDGTRGPWQKLKHAVSEDDEVVAVDGDASATLLVMTDEVENACPGSGSTPERVRAIRVDRASGDDALIDLAPVDCERGAPGPFWIADAPGGQAVVWVEHKSASAPKGPPVVGFAYRVPRADGIRAGRIEQQADSAVDAGCDETGCSVAVLVRPAGSDGMRPAPIRVFQYP